MESAACRAKEAISERDRQSEQLADSLNAVSERFRKTQNQAIEDKHNLKSQVICNVAFHQLHLSRPHNCIQGPEKPMLLYTYHAYCVKIQLQYCVSPSKAAYKDLSIHEWVDM